MDENFLDTLTDFLVSHIDPLDSAERAIAYDRVIAALERERDTARTLAVLNERLDGDALATWEHEGGASVEVQYA